MNFVARLRSASDKGRNTSPPISVPANPFYSTMIRLMQVSQDTTLQTEAVNVAKSYAAKGELAGLQLALSVARIQAQETIKQIENIAALFPPHDIDSSTQVYGERT